MARAVKLNCTNCGNAPKGANDDEKRKNLYVKRVEFRGFGYRGRSIRNRVVAWLCSDCMVNDPDFRIHEMAIAEKMSV